MQALSVCIYSTLICIHTHTHTRISTIDVSVMEKLLDCSRFVDGHSYLAMSIHVAGVRPLSALDKRFVIGKDSVMSLVSLNVPLLMLGVHMRSYWIWQTLLLVTQSNQSQTFFDGHRSKTTNVSNIFLLLLLVFHLFIRILEAVIPFFFFKFGWCIQMIITDDEYEK